MSMPPHKRQRLSDDDGEQDSDSQLESDDEGSSTNASDDEISTLKPKKSAQTKKRKLRATAPSNFAVTLQSLLNTHAPTDLPLSLKPSLARKRNDQKLEVKAKKALQMEKKEREDKGRITDVIGGWGNESERALRKVAQRGGTSLIYLSLTCPHCSAVVKLFNVIQQSQTAAVSAQEEKKAARGSGKPSLGAPVISDPKGKKKGKKITLMSTTARRGA